MNTIDPDAGAALVASIHAPWKATVRECLARWSTLDAPAREYSYLVVQEGGDRRRTLNAHAIGELCTQLC